MREVKIALFLVPFLLHGTGGSANKGVPCGDGTILVGVPI